MKKILIDSFFAMIFSIVTGSSLFIIDKFIYKSKLVAPFDTSLIVGAICYWGFLLYNNNKNKNGNKNKQNKSPKNP
ncbi:hypothetical protein DRN73_07495 [Candidatus Pacearchaeota archaeon]|nr:MAG: hypothetical protein DRN73_07495 [Candidatus Pacearchaeota archaeon]